MTATMAKLTPRIIQAPLPMIVTPPLLDPAVVYQAFYPELSGRKYGIDPTEDQPYFRLAIEMLRRADARYFTGPSGTSGKYHPKDEFVSGPAGDPSGAPVNRDGLNGGQVLHCKRVAALYRELCRSHEWAAGSHEWNLLIVTALVHDMAQFEHGRTHTVKYHEALVGPITQDIPLRCPELADLYQAVIRLSEVHSGPWCGNAAHRPVTDIEWLVHYGDMLASRRGIGTFDPYGSDG